MNHRSHLALCLVLTASAPCFALSAVQTQETAQSADSSTKTLEEGAAEEATDKKQRRRIFTIAPYFLFPFFQGEAEVGGFPVDLDVNPADVIGALDWGIMLYLEVKLPKWAAMADFTYMDLGKGSQIDVGPREQTEVDAELDMKMLVAQFHGLRRLASWAELGLGVRIVYQKVGLDAEVEPGLPIPEEDRDIDVEGHRTWVDPLIATRLTLPFWDKWRVGVLADFGGFYVGSNYSWQAYVYGGYKIIPIFEIGLAFRALGMKYVDGSGRDSYVWDAVIFGPEIGFLIHL